MSEMRRFVYFGKRPTNVCFNGVSFPVLPGDVIKCYPEFIANFISPKWYKEAKDTNTKPAKHTFPRSPFFLKPDPQGGLPMRSDPNAGPRLKDNPRYMSRAVLLKDEVPVNPYEKEAGGAKEALPKVEAPKLEISTRPQSVVATVDPVAPVEETIEIEEYDEVVVEEEALVESTEVIIRPSPTKSELRKATRDDIYLRVVGTRADGCPLKPEMLDIFNAFTEESTRGEMFAALWGYYDFDKE